MSGISIFLITILITVCAGQSIWNRPPVYVIERFPVSESQNTKFPLKGSGSGLPFVVTPMETVLAEKPSAEAKNKKLSSTPLPKLVKDISTYHKAKIESLHTPCHQTGCQKGSQCVYDRMWMCPVYILELDCACKPGCAVGNTFIPMGKTLTMDECGNKCSCRDPNGEAVCTKKKCDPIPKEKDVNMDSLLKYIKKLVNIKLQDKETPVVTEKPLTKTGASGDVEQRRTTSNDIKTSHKIGFVAETRFPYNPHRPMYVRT